MYCFVLSDLVPNILPKVTFIDTFFFNAVILAFASKAQCLWQPKVLLIWQQLIQSSRNWTHFLGESL